MKEKQEISIQPARNGFSTGTGSIYHGLVRHLTPQGRRLYEQLTNGKELFDEETRDLQFLLYMHCWRADRCPDYVFREDEVNAYVYYDAREKTWKVGCATARRTPGVVYFPSTVAGELRDTMNQSSDALVRRYGQGTPLKYRSGIVPRFRRQKRAASSL
jgi:hypothetical protein